MLLKNNNLEKELAKNGFIVVPFLNEQEVHALNELYERVNHNQEPPEFIDNIHMTSWCSNVSYKQSVSEQLNSLFTQATERFFKDFRCLNNVFIVKRQGQQTTFKVHQDWNVVDENKFQSVNVWVPLHDVTERSGALWVLKGSHNINRKIRGAGYLFPDYGAFMEQLEKKSISVKLRAGQAVIFYHSLIHGSPPNLDVAYRKSACFSVIPKQAPLCIYFQPGANSPLQEHQPPDNFVFNYEHLRSQSLTIPPSPKPHKIYEPYENKKVGAAELARLIKPPSALDRLRKLLSLSTD